MACGSSPATPCWRPDTTFRLAPKPCHWPTSPCLGRPGVLASVIIYIDASLDARHHSLGSASLGGHGGRFSGSMRQRTLPSVRGRLASRPRHRRNFNPLRHRLPFGCSPFWGWMRKCAAAWPTSRPLLGLYTLARLWHIAQKGDARLGHAQSFALHARGFGFGTNSERFIVRNPRRAGPQRNRGHGKNSTMRSRWLFYVYVRAWSAKCD
jgi:hypothetical protein